ncbi:MAG: adenylate cyclase [Actinomycetaceae bacterium]|nr:adenylate cyclase [Actinomycetaceae bacterium]MDY5854399.1 adenylate cyclase [Arcanobacterium sp.]
MSEIWQGLDGREFPFEFERKFYVEELPLEVREHGSQNVIVQAYVFAEAGYAVRVRMSFQGVSVPLPSFNEATDHVGAYERKVLEQLMAAVEKSEQTQEAAHNQQQAGQLGQRRQAEYSEQLAHMSVESAESVGVAATIAVKSPPVSGERYELENELDPDVAVQILHRSAHLVLKTRYSMWYGEDGWEFDVFGGQNHGLIVAECERISPVVDLAVPPFCVTELTGDLRFTNDYLSKEPWSQWAHQFRAELAARGPFFLKLTS